MNTRFDLKVRLAILLCVAGLFLAVCGGLFALADGIADMSVESTTTEGSLLTPTEEIADIDPAPQDPGEEIAQPPVDEPEMTTTSATDGGDEPLPDTSEPLGSLPTVSEPSLPLTSEPIITAPTTSLPKTDEPSTLPPATTEPSTLPPATTEPSTLPPATTEPLTTPPVTTESVVTTTTVVTTTAKPNYTTDPVTKTGALQSVPPSPMSTDPVEGAPAVTTPPTGENQPPVPTVTAKPATPNLPGVTTDDSDQDEDAKDDEKKPGVVEVDEEARRAGLTRLAGIFGVAFIVALAAMMLAKFVKIP